MRRYMSWCVLLCFVAFLFCGIAQAADSGICAVNEEANVQVIPAGEDDGKGAYEGAEKMTVTYSSAQPGKQYLVMAVTNDAITESGILPSISNIVYMDQTDEQGAPGDTVSFLVYPSELKTGTYHICMSSNANNGISLHDIAEIASFDFYKYGDLNGDGIIDILDISRLIMNVVKDEPVSEGMRKSSDFTGYGVIDILDISRLIMHYVADVPLLDVE